MLFFSWSVALDTWSLENAAGFFLDSRYWLSFRISEVTLQWQNIPYLRAHVARTYCMGFMQHELSQSFFGCWDIIPNAGKLKEERFILVKISGHSRLAWRLEGTAQGPGGAELLTAWRTGRECRAGGGERNPSRSCALWPWFPPDPCHSKSAGSPRAHRRSTP